MPPAFGSVNVNGIDPDESDEYFMIVAGFLTPPVFTWGRWTSRAAKAQESARVLQADGLAISQHEATSKDGTKVPYFQVSRKDLKLDGDNPTLLYGYGGFEIPMLPHYNAGVGAAWLERGGVYVLANIRGGGEFGPRWHEAARKEHRQRAYDDFIAVAEDLIRENSPRPSNWASRRFQRRIADGRHADERPDLFGGRVPGAAARYAPIQQIAGRRKLDGGIRRPGQAGRLGLHQVAIRHIRTSTGPPITPEFSLPPQPAMIVSTPATLERW